MRILALLIVILASQSNANTDFDFIGRGTHRFNTYTNSSNHSAGQDNWVELEQKAKFNKELSVKARVVGYVGTHRADLIQIQDAITYSTQVADIWPDDVYVQLATGPLLAKLGYQKITWQEGFALSYTNFVNAKDFRNYIFEDSVLFTRSAPMANIIVSGEHLSIQGVYLPYSQLDISAPPSRWGTAITSLISATQTLQVLKSEVKEPSHEYGGRLTWAGRGFDVSLFYFFLKDRQPIYSLSNTSTPINIKLQPTQNFMSVMGATTSINIGDSVLRLEGTRTPRRQIMSIQNGQLGSADVNEMAATISLDCPLVDHLNVIAQSSASVIDLDTTTLIRKKNEFLSLLTLRYDFQSERILSATGLYHESDHSLFTRVQFSWPYSKGVEMQVGWDFGNEIGLSNSYKDMHQVYFQLAHNF